MSEHEISTEERAAIRDFGAHDSLSALRLRLLDALEAAERERDTANKVAEDRREDCASLALLIDRRIAERDAAARKLEELQGAGERLTRDLCELFDVIVAFAKSAGAPAADVAECEAKITAIRAAANEVVRGKKWGRPSQIAERHRGLCARPNAATGGK